MRKANQTIDCALPRYDKDCREWRLQVLKNARIALPNPSDWEVDGPFEVIALLYLTQGQQHDRSDVDNVLKGILDGLQGACYRKADGKKRHHERLIRNDRTVCRAVVEKHLLPKKYLNRENRPGGRLLVRRYSPCAWRTLSRRIQGAEASGIRKGGE